MFWGRRKFQTLCSRRDEEKRPGNMEAREKTFGGRTGLASQTEGPN